MELQTQGPVDTAIPAGVPRARRRLAGALGIAALMGLTLGGATVAGASPAPAPTLVQNVTVGGGVATEIAPADGEKIDAAFAKYAACMRDAGIDMPEPVVVEAGPAGAGGATGATIVGSGTVSGSATIVGSLSATATEIDGEAFAAADKVCGPILEAAGIKQLSASVAGSTGGQLGAGAAGAIMVGGATIVGGAAAGSGDVAAMAAPIQKYAACMREHGVDVPDPVVDEKAGTFEMRVDVDPATSEFRAADAVCADGSGFSFAVPAGPAGQ